MSRTFTVSILSLGPERLKDFGTSGGEKVRPLSGPSRSSMCDPTSNPGSPEPRTYTTDRGEGPSVSRAARAVSPRRPMGPPNVPADVGRHVSGPASASSYPLPAGFRER